ncbi:MAG: CDP-diacylglycerol--glycerol-3-phosphate 3-phosphatidyltransferase [Candidatus Omnitrophica bacterium]|nr:CDP-diacylglycerol--glycerol-3-phosphate 3-phosphatidyltransferase [Candidatus Omnitrophota bacterium]MBU4149459.1 CDP-diacylglycerol--glycerol-3-phosphate 3-phosphatidyltransferase [Candidatus Omnitrophota bacterium]
MNLANKITIFRILLIPFFIASILYYGEARPYFRFVALALFALAALTDAIDGGIARSRGQVTELGVVLDPVADKLLIASAFIALSVTKNLPPDLRIPAWVVLIVLTRDIIIVLGSVIIYFLKGDVTIKPSFLGKATTFFQMIAILAILTVFRSHRFFVYPAAFFTILSGIDYIWRGSRQLNEA